MRRVPLLLVLVLIALGVVLATAGGDVAAGDAAIAWETDLAAATEKAKESGRPLMVVFR